MKKGLLSIIAFLSVGVFTLQAQIVSTFAGTGSTGSGDGAGAEVSFFFPGGLACDALGNIYVADGHNHKIRKITSSGTVNTVSGNGNFGSLDGADPTFYYPQGVALDTLGNIYVADYYNHKIRKISTTGIVSTFAGNGSIGSTDGIGTDATFVNPYGLAVDKFGNVYVADFGVNKIRKITPDGVVSSFAGNTTAGSADGKGTVASFNGPYGITIDLNGNLYVADTGNKKIRKITPDGDVTTVAGNGTFGSVDGPGLSASFKNPLGVAADRYGNIYIADTGNNKIRKINPAGFVTTIAGNGKTGTTNGIGSKATFDFPQGIAVDAAGNVYVSDHNSHKIRKITITAATLSSTLICNNRVIDDFASPFEYQMQTTDIKWDEVTDSPQPWLYANKGAYWWNVNSKNGLIATNSRSNAKLHYTITQPYGSYENFGLTFGVYGNSNSQKTFYTVDLSNNANISFKFNNEGDSTLRLQIQIQDINNKVLLFDKAAVSDKSNSYLYLLGLLNNTTLAPHSSATYTYDLNNAVTGRYSSNCSPCIDNDNSSFDFSKVTTIFFLVVNDHSNIFDGYKTYKLSNYPVSFESFVLGDASNCVQLETSINDNKAFSESTLKVYPIPASQQLHIESAEIISNYEIIGLAGNSFAKEELQNNTIEIKELSTGIYFLKLTSKTGSVRVIKFIKE